jgi:hypothetical protein
MELPASEKTAQFAEKICVAEKICSTDAAVSQPGVGNTGVVSDSVGSSASAVSSDAPLHPVDEAPDRRSPSIEGRPSVEGRPSIEGSRLDASPADESQIADSWLIATAMSAPRDSPAEAALRQTIDEPVLSKPVLEEAWCGGSGWVGGNDVCAS